MGASHNEAIQAIGELLLFPITVMAAAHSNLSRSRGDPESTDFYSSTRYKVDTKLFTDNNAEFREYIPQPDTSEKVAIRMNPE